ncbi:MAG: bifunctional hydroxymethylpyrimidine kinase/phosphomethylpyrimidine kinase [Chlorobiaceae bacterium]|nr:bifunctional hydroxymethylpyrimidine kinase/phosphomethylpyrimidine kinase [Chlorobiaceae bacterium]
MNQQKDYTTVLTIAGSDGSGGAGIQADLKTVAACGCYGLSVITAITAQNTMGVLDSYAVPAPFIARQFTAIAEEIGIDAVKIGMLGSQEAAETVAELIGGLKRVPVVLDTVLRSTGGKELFPAYAAASMRRLFPLATLITPNLPEAALLSGCEQNPSSEAEIEKMARMLQRDGANSVLVKGGHGEGSECRDCLLHEGRFYWFSNRRIATNNTHGTGCTLSSAIASGLAKGEAMADAVGKAIAYTNSALQSGALWRLGRGNGPLQHFPQVSFATRANRPME